MRNVYSQSWDRKVVRIILLWQKEICKVLMIGQWTIIIQGGEGKTVGETGNGWRLGNRKKG